MYQNNLVREELPFTAEPQAAKSLSSDLFKTTGNFCCIMCEITPKLCENMPYQAVIIFTKANSAVCGGSDEICKNKHLAEERQRVEFSVRKIRSKTGREGKGEELDSVLFSSLL